MSYGNKEYQVKAIGQLVKSVSELLAKDASNKVCVFQSPTGSGKTVMVAKFIEEIIKELPEIDLCFLWVSIGKGDLHKQSKKSLDLANKSAMSFGEAMKQAAYKFGIWSAITASYYKVIREISTGIKFVTEMDTALTEIGMVTNQTREQTAYNQNIKNPTQRT